MTAHAFNMAGAFQIQQSIINIFIVQQGMSCNNIYEYKCHTMIVIRKFYFKFPTLNLWNCIIAMYIFYLYRYTPLHFRPRPEPPPMCSTCFPRQVAKQVLRGIATLRHRLSRRASSSQKTGRRGGARVLGARSPEHRRC